MFIDDINFFSNMLSSQSHYELNYVPLQEIVNIVPKTRIKIDEHAFFVAGQTAWNSSMLLIMTEPHANQHNYICLKINLNKLTLDITKCKVKNCYKV